MATAAVSRQAADDLIGARLARESLKDFVQEAWHVVEPATPFSDNWHLDAICEHLEAVTDGQIRNLLINMPPRCAKSTIVAVMWPMWVWIAHPDRRWLFSSYALSLAIRDSVKCRRLIESPWYQRHFGASFTLADDQNAKSRFENDHRGSRLALSVGSGVTGEGGDVICVDDPHNVKYADSALIREATLEWWDQAMSTRLNNPKTGAKVIVMQRVHDGDLSGHVLQQGGYEHLVLPMEYEPSRAHVTSIGWSDPRHDESELLWPTRIGENEVANLKRTLGTYGYAGQCQQRPAPREGGFLKREWLGLRYRSVEALTPTLTRVVQSVDSAFKQGVSTDYSVIATWGVVASGPQAGYHLLSVWRARVAYPELIRAVKDQHAAALARGWNVNAILVEDKGSGQSAIQTLRAETHLPIIGVPAMGSKEARFDDVTPLFEAGRVWLPESAAWLDAWMDEHLNFPRAEHDDQVDTTSYALAYLRDKGQWLDHIRQRASLRQHAIAAQRGATGNATLAHPGATGTPSEQPATTPATPAPDGFSWPW